MTNTVILHQRCPELLRGERKNIKLIPQPMVKYLNISLVMGILWKYKWNSVSLTQFEWEILLPKYHASTKWLHNKAPNTCLWKTSLFCSEIMYLGKLKLNVVQMHWQKFHEELCLLLSWLRLWLWGFQSVLL